MSEVVLEAPVQVEQTVDEKIDAQLTDMMGQGRNANNMVDMQLVRLYPNHVEVELNGIKKAISLLDFKQIIDQQLQVENKLQNIALPYNTYMFSRSTTEIHLSCYYPERRLNLKFSARGGAAKLFKDCIVPNILISHKLKLDNNQWLVADSRYMATNKKVTELPEDRMLLAPEGEGMWRVPFPNFYNDYRMCYGGNTMPMRFTNNLRGLDYFYQIISESPFNTDLGINVREYGDNIGGWFEFLKTAETFPYDKLSSTARY